MSNALVTVTFKDGFRLYTQYQGSSDTFSPALFNTPEEVWSHNRHTDGWKELLREEKPRELEVVHVHNGYGGGSDGYEARACRHTKQLRVWHEWLNDGWAHNFTFDDWLKSLEKEKDSHD